MRVEKLNLKPSNGIGGDGGVSTTHVGRGIDVVERGCEDKWFGILGSDIGGGASAE